MDDIHSALRGAQEGARMERRCSACKLVMLPGIRWGRTSRPRSSRPSWPWLVVSKLSGWSLSRAIPSRRIPVSFGKGCLEREAFHAPVACCGWRVLYPILLNRRCCL